MATTSDPQVQAGNQQDIPWTPVKKPLEAWIEQWEKDGVTLELIVAMIMSNSQGDGAMDVVSESIAGITEQSNVLSAVQSDVITLNAILSKIESQLGTTANPTIGTFPQSLLLQFQSTYKKLFVSNAKNPNGESDIAELASFQSKFPTLKPVVSGVENWQKDYFSKSLNGSPRSFDQDVRNWTGTRDGFDPFIQDIEYLAKEHYSANHPTKNGGKSSTTDYLQNWWTAGNADQQLLGGQSQQDTTEVQSYMQLLQGFDSSGQQIIQLASTQKSQIIQNEKTS